MNAYTLAGDPKSAKRAVLLDQLGWNSALVAGASMGGCVALAFAKKHAGRVSALGLFDTTAWYGPDAPRQWEERAQKALEGGLKALVDFHVTRWFSDAFRAAADLRSVLRGIAVPTAVIVGEEDYATPIAMAEELHKSIQGSTLRVLKKARHLTPLEQPGEIAAQLQRLLQPVAVA